MTAYKTNPHRAEFESVLMQLADKWHNQLSKITNTWTVSHNNKGKIIDHHPVIRVEFRDGTVVPALHLDTELTEGSAIQFSDNPNILAFEAFVRSVVNKHHTELKDFTHSWVRLRDKEGKVLDTQPAVEILFKSAEDYAEELNQRGATAYANQK